ncbi:hypothetical protein BD289DRAFT_256866 [Coniella lustricola]|uniref:Uncharacterized protein n=1 Tax=Coniella lustricola TaxID=2025994 RepID=A0A2T3AKU5_9PEZI|nr:hypothetical protein BD289DRAFT_256866 [Coniella lustricola]
MRMRASFLMMLRLQSDSIVHLNIDTQHFEMERLPPQTQSLPSMPPLLLTPPSPANDGLSCIPSFHSSPGPMLAPISHMDFPSSIPAKRGPEDDVQFVSAHLVKKARSGIESAPIGAQQIPQQVHQQVLQQSNVQPHDKNDITQYPQDPQQHSFGGSTMGTHTLGRRASIAGLENYVFPQPINSTPCQTSRSSPMLSPKQLPRPMLQDPAIGTIQPSEATATSTATSLQHAGLQTPWGMAGLYPQPASIPVPTGWSSQMSLPPSQAQHVERPPSEPEKAPSQPPPARLCTPQEQDPVQFVQSNASHAQAKDPSRHPAEHLRNNSPTRPNSMPSPQPGPKIGDISPAQETAVNDRARTTAQSPTIPAASYTSHTAYPQVSTKPLPQIPKPPCLICEQMRHQAFLNQANGLPVGHHLHLQQQAWQGLSPFQQQLHLVNPSATASVVGLQNYQMRHQPFHTGQYPVGFAMPQVQVPVQVPIQRVAQVVNTNPEEQWQGERPQNGQTHSNPAVDTNQTTRDQLQVAQPARHAYLQTAVAPPQPSAVTARPHVIPCVQQSATAVPLAPPSTVLATAVQQTQPPVVAQSPKPMTHSELRNFSPNLIVDIAETCEGVFPWDEVAQRHGVSRTKIIETFSAIIQLPLLRCTTDKKRHGKLATNRLREYTKAKKDAEAAATATTKTVAPAKSSPKPTASQNNLPRGPQGNGEGLAQADNPHSSYKTPILPSIFEMANTMAPVKLPSTLAHSFAEQ